LIMRRVNILDIDICEGKCSESIRTVGNCSCKDGVSKLTCQRDRLAIDQDRSASLQNGFWGAFDEKCATAIESYEDGHHLAVPRKLEGKQTRDFAFEEVVDGISAGCGRKFRK
jgi:hypothetical protein